MHRMKDPQRYETVHPPTCDKVKVTLCLPAPRCLDAEAGRRLHTALRCLMLMVWLRTKEEVTSVWWFFSPGLSLRITRMAGPTKQSGMFLNAIEQRPAFAMSTIGLAFFSPRKERRLNLSFNAVSF